MVIMLLTKVGFNFNWKKRVCDLLQQKIALNLNIEMTMEPLFSVFYATQWRSGVL